MAEAASQDAEAADPQRLVTLAQAETDEDELLGEDDFLGDEDEDELLDEEDEEKDVEAEPEVEEMKTTVATADEDHEALFAEDRYPSANTCAVCHPKQYREWSVSQHAYAQLSPVYMAMQMTINAKTSTTNGDFCIRCHTQVGMNIGEDVFTSNLDRHPTSREGITCVICHRVNRNYGKVSGRRALVEGDLYGPVFGPRGGEELERVLSDPQTYRVSADRNKPGRGIHV